MSNTSWEKSSKWYQKIVGPEGHYYHQKVVLPNTLRLLKLDKTSKLLDLGCGQGILERSVPQDIDYLGVDLSPELIRQAKQLSINKKHMFLVADASRPLPTSENGFTHAAIILALQNIRKPFGVIRNVKEKLLPGGKLLIVLNHPAFRIPKHSSWEVDDSQNVQYRKNDAYMSSLEIPILTNPGKKGSDTTWSFHYPISAYTEMLYDNGFMIEIIEEWVSDKKSTGSKARMEDRARKEFPLFMAILVRKI